MSLWEQFNNNRGRMINKWAHYLPIYERHFSVFKDRAPLIIEIGSGDGGSAQMWKRYFGPSARIVSLDIREECRSYEEDQIEIRIGDQSDHDFLAEIINEYGCPDIILDDGSHMMAHIAASFCYLYPKLSNRGVYLVEDLHTAYWPEFGGGLGTPESFVEAAKSLVDQLNGYHIRDQPISTFTRTLNSIHFYDSIVVFEKMPRQRPRNLRV